jgi:hypothetical protein
VNVEVRDGVVVRITSRAELDGQKRKRRPPALSDAVSKQGVNAGFRRKQRCSPQVRVAVGYKFGRVLLATFCQRLVDLEPTTVAPWLIGVAVATWVFTRSALTNMTSPPLKARHGFGVLGAMALGALTFAWGLSDPDRCKPVYQAMVAVGVPALALTVGLATWLHRRNGRRANG